MGIFSSKSKTQVGTSINRVIDDNSLPNSVLSGSIKALFNNGNSSDYLIEELISSIGVRAERMYSYASNKYPIGLPSGNYFTSSQGKPEVRAVLEALEGRQVSIEYCNYGPPNSLHIGWMALQSQYNYNAETNEIISLSTLKNTKVYLEDMVVVVPSSQVERYELASFDQWGIPPTGGFTPIRAAGRKVAKHSPIKQADDSVVPYLLVTYVWANSNNAWANLTHAIDSVKRETLIIPITGYDDRADYFHSKYMVGTSTKYVIYKANSGLYPTLDNIYTESATVAGTYFPFVYFRFNKKPASDSISSTAMAATKRMTKYLGMDYDYVAENINANPDIKDVEQAMLMFAVPPQSENPIECRYLFDYFESLSNTVIGDVYSTLEDIRARLAGEPTKERAIVIKDSLFKMALSYDGISQQTMVGSIGSIGTHTSSYGQTAFTTEVTSIHTNETTTVINYGNAYTYKKQISETMYEQITVRDLKMTYYVLGNYTTTGDETDDILLVPIDRAISSQYSISDREELYSRSMHFIFNSSVVTKVKWYQTGIFKIFMIIVAIAITIYTYGADGGSAIATTLGLTGTEGLIATVIMTLAAGQLMPAVFKIFVKVVGKDFATVVAIIAVLYGSYQLFQPGSIQGAPWAMDLVQMSNGLYQAIIQADFLDLMKDAESFALFVKEQTETLEKAEDLLASGRLLNPLIVFGESPEDFYNRTVHSGNIGILGINAISSYVDIALTLPKLNETLGANA